MKVDTLEKNNRNLSKRLFLKEMACQTIWDYLMP